MSATPTPYQASKKLFDAARHWAVSRNRLRTLMSKKAPDAIVEKAKKAHIEDANKLEAAVIQFEHVYRQVTARTAPKKPKKPFPWKKVLGAVAQGATILDKALNEEPPPIRARVIDTSGETVNR